MNSYSASKARKGRGALSNPQNRYASEQSLASDDGWWQNPDDAPPEKLETLLRLDPARKIISRNDSTDVPMNLTINPYRGCEHGCIYCFARPSHAWLDHSPGTDFETQLYYKPGAPELLRRELAKKGYLCEPITIGANTDPYQPIEAQFEITRQLLEVCLEYRQPVSIITKGSLILRDLDLLSVLAELRLTSVNISVTSLNNAIKRTLEPRAASASQRLKVIRSLSQAGVPVNALVAPIIPAITDAELEQIIAAVAKAGASSAGYVLLRLPLEVAPLFEEWLNEHYPQRAEHVLNRMRDLHEGKLYRSEFGTRQRGTGEYARLLAQRFRIACKRAGLLGGSAPLDCGQFRVPTAQIGLF